LRIPTALILTTQAAGTAMTSKPAAWLCESKDGSVRYVAMTRDESSQDWKQTPLYRADADLSALLQRLLSPEDLGHAVSAEVRAALARALGISE
jgi:hypothetical protein